MATSGNSTKENVAALSPTLPPLDWVKIPREFCFLHIWTRCNACIGYCEFWHDEYCDCTYNNYQALDGCVGRDYLHFLEQFLKQLIDDGYQTDYIPPWYDYDIQLKERFHQAFLQFKTTHRVEIIKALGYEK